MVTSVLQLEQAAELLDNRDNLEIINEVMNKITILSHHGFPNLSVQVKKNLVFGVPDVKFLGKNWCFKPKVVVRCVRVIESSAFLQKLTRVEIGFFLKMSRINGAIVYHTSDLQLGR